MNPRPLTGVTLPVVCFLIYVMCCCARCVCTRACACPELAKTGSQLGVIDTPTSQLTQLDTGFTAFGRLAVTGPGLADAEGEITVVTVAGSASKAGAVVMLQVRSHTPAHTHRAASIALPCPDRQICLHT